MTARCRMNASWMTRANLPRKGSALLALVLVLILALAACSVETREERQQRLAEKQGQQTTEQQIVEQQDSAAQDSGALDSGASGSSGMAKGEAAQGLDASGPEPVTPEAVSPDSMSPNSGDASGMAAPDQAAPDQAVPDSGAPAVQQDAAQSSLYEAAIQALDQDPAAVVRAFFTQVTDGDLAVLEPLVAKDQHQELKKLLAYLEEQKNLPDNPLLGVDKVEVMQTTISAVVDVNVTVRLADGPHTSAESIELVYEDGAWRLANVDY